MTWSELFAALKRPLPLLAVLAGMVGVAMLGGAIATDRTLFGPITAAWVQAIGSVSAILAAIWIASRQGRRNDFDRWEAVATKVQIARFLSAQLLEAMSAAKRDCSLKKPPTFDPENFGSIRTGLDEIPLIDLHSGKLAISILNQRRGAFFYQRALAKWVEVAERMHAGIDEPNASAEMQANPFYDREAAQLIILTGIQAALAKLEATAVKVHAEVIAETDWVASIRPT